MADGGAPAKGQVSRRLILEAAAALFREKGYAEVSLREIALAANMKTGSLYYHFESKEALVEAILTLGTQGALTAARQATLALGEGADPVDRLRAAFTAHARFLLEEQDFASANLKILPQVPPAVRERHVRQDRELGDFVAGIIEEIAAAGRLADGVDPTLLRMLCFGALNWSISWFDPKGRTPTQIADQLMLIVCQGALRAPPVTPSP